MDRPTPTAPTTGKWCPPARYLATLTPLLALPLAQTLLVLRRSTVYKIVFGLLTVVLGVRKLREAGYSMAAVLSTVKQQARES